MTNYPKYLNSYPNMDSAFPLHISLNRLELGYPAHRHDFLEFSYVIEGTGAETIDGVRHPMAPGTFTFLLPYQVHELFTDPGSALVLYNCNFGLELLAGPGAGKGRLGELLDRLDELPSYVQFEASDIEPMRAIVEEMLREYKGDSRWRETLLEAKLRETLVRFDRYREAAADGPAARSASGDGLAAGGTRGGAPRGRTGGRSSAWPIVHYIHMHYQEELALSDLAKRFSLSLSRLSEVIKEATGQTFVHFLHDLRLRQACSLLASTEMSVMDIACEVGYGSYKTFSRIFRDSKGMAPTEYRKRKRQAAAAGN